MIKFGTIFTMYVLQVAWLQIDNMCCRGLSDGWEKILGLYSSVREKGKEIIDQVRFFPFKRITSLWHIYFNIYCQENLEVMLEPIEVFQIWLHTLFFQKLLLLKL